MEKENIIGIFNSTNDVNNVLSSLGGRGYTDSDVAILAKEDALAEIDVDASSTESLKEGAMDGAKTGGIAGGVLGLLVGIGALAIPGVGALLVTGPLAAALGLTGAVATTASGAATGAIAGGLIGALVKWGLDQQTAEKIENAVKQGKVMLLVVANDEDDDYVEELMKNNNAEEVIEVEKN